MLKLLTLLVIVSAVSAAGNTCKTGNIVNRLVNSKPYYWPSTWNETQSTPHLAKEQSCSWIVTIPNGYYAKLSISGKTTDKDSRFQTIDAVGNFIQTTHEGMEPYYFPPTKFTLAVSNEAVASFAFKIEWFPLPRTTRINFIGEEADLINATNHLFCESYGGNGGITLLPLPINRTHYYSLRSTLVFQGHDTDNGIYISNLFLLYQTKKLYINEYDIVVANLEASNKQDLLLIQEAQNIKNVTYVELIPEPHSNVTVTVNSHKTQEALLIAYQVNQTLVDVQMDASATVTLYYGSPGGFSFDKTYNKTALLSALPLQFNVFGGVTELFVTAKATFTFEYL
ncbi:hypothetical protein GCK72_020179 [Caenorhabditis remanei]|uniref:CUB-like domain-containing protein n=1 Tax=Caenorhabditis remanei TaxID=31234 RepID=A0A6A5GGJ9_CAERE|nr:hypothetical protein GCK72_020179 [Caenorhabditis remanei]KAF1753622.1 hypothetical protein GCK72_020179 [Caenorhabditis remanei]